MKAIIAVSMFMAGCSSVTYQAKDKATVKVFKDGVEVLGDGVVRCRVKGPVEVKHDP